MATATDAPIYDPYDASMHEKYPAALYKHLRDMASPYRNADCGFWALSRFSEVQEASRDWRTFSSAGPLGVDIDGTGTGLYGVGNFLEADPPSHDQLRDVVRGAFGPKRIARLERDVSQRAATLLEPLQSAGGGDIARQVCWQLAYDVVAHLLGIPPSDWAAVADLLLRASRRSPGQRQIPDDAVAAAAALRHYVDSLLGESRQLDSGLLATVAEACDSGVISAEQAPGIGMLFLGAGVETPATFVSNSLYLLATHPDQRAHLVEREVDIEAAIEELLRFESPVQCLARTTTRATEVRGARLPADAVVLLVYAAANRDDRRWDNADRLDISRQHQRHLAFGEGLHFCLGAPLARLEAKLVIRLMLERCPAYEVAGPITRLVKYSDWGILGLPVAM
jgi:cytochrome P450